MGDKLAIDPERILLVLLRKTWHLKVFSIDTLRTDELTRGVVALLIWICPEFASFYVGILRIEILVQGVSASALGASGCQVLRGLADLVLPLSEIMGTTVPIDVPLCL